MGTTGPSDDEAVVARLGAASPEVWSDLWRAVDELLRERPWVEWRPPKRNPDGSFQVGYPVYGEPVLRVERLLYDLGVIGALDWMDWRGYERYPGGSGLESAPIADAVRIIIAVFRSERFGEGQIDEAMSTGLLPKALLRLRRWYTNER